MKKIGLLLLMVIFVASCGPKAMNLMYSAAQKDKLETAPIYLTVKDGREKKWILSPAVVELEVFDVSGGRFNLATKSPDGRSSEVKNVEVAAAFREAFNVRLASQGIQVAPESSPTTSALTITVLKVFLDRQGQNFLAEVEYEAAFAKGGKIYKKDTISGSAKQLFVLDKGETGEETLSQALTSAVNGLDLAPLNK